MYSGHPPEWIVVVAGSSGGVQALSDLVAHLPADLPAAVLIVNHTPATSKRRLPMLLSAAGPLPASYPDEAQVLEAGRILVAPPDRHLTVQGGKIHLTSGEKEHGMRPAADVLFRSAARTFGSRSIGIVLSGSGRDGAAGLVEIHAAGGVALIQEPGDATFAAMPSNALALVRPEACVPAAELGAIVARFIHERDPAARGSARRRAPRARQRWHPRSLKGLRVFVAEDEYLIASEIVSMLRTLECGAVGPVADIAAGLRLLEQKHGRMDCAVLDVDLRGETALPLALALTRWAVPFVFATGYGESALPERWAGAPRLQKPYDARALGTALRRALSLRWFPPPEVASSTSGGLSKEEVLKDSRNLLMRYRALQAVSLGHALMTSYEAIRKTHERIATSARRKEAARRALRGWPSSGSDKAEDAGGKDT